MVHPNATQQAREKEREIREAQSPENAWEAHTNGPDFLDSAMLPFSHIKPISFATF